MRVLIVDDHILFREGLAGLLREQADMQVVAECGTVSEAIQHASAAMPDVVLMDFTLPDGTGVEATRSILAKNPHINIIFLTVHEDDERLLSAVRAGAKGYLLKNLSVNKLLASLRSLDRGEVALSRAMMAKIVEEFAHNPEENQKAAPSPLVLLTAREVEVLKELASGVTNQEIANQLFISENTVKNHVHNILDKLKLSNRRQATLFARENGLISKRSD